MYYPQAHERTGFSSPNPNPEPPSNILEASSSPSSQPMPTTTTTTTSHNSAAFPGTLHRYTRHLVAFEHLPGAPSDGPSSHPVASSGSGTPTNYLLWLGGLGDGLLTVGYAGTLAAFLPHPWRLVEVLLSSTYRGWGTGSLARDAREVGEAVAYFRGLQRLQAGTGAGPERAKVVLMGHSTGCQDIMEYLTGKGCEGRPKVDGAVLQGPVSDREGLVHSLGEEEYARIAGAAEKMVEEGNGDEVVPRGLAKRIYGNAPITAYRLLSLLSPGKDGDDDYFSSDLPAERLKQSFGKVGEAGAPLCILFSGRDQFVPDFVKPEALVKQWSQIVAEGGGFVDEENSGIVDGATHNLNDDPEEVVMRLVRRVRKFLDRVRFEGFKSSTHL